MVSSNKDSFLMTVAYLIYHYLINRICVISYLITDQGTNEAISTMVVHYVNIFTIDDNVL